MVVYPHSFYAFHIIITCTSKVLVPSNNQMSIDDQAKHIVNSGEVGDVVTSRRLPTITIVKPIKLGDKEHSNNFK